MILHALMQLLLPVGVAANAALIVYLVMLVRQTRKLNLLLDAICFRALCNRHVPVWQPWCVMRGLNFVIKTYPAGEQP